MESSPVLDDRLGDFTADIRILPLTGMAALIGVISAYVALALVRLIGFFTHVFYYQDLGTSLVSPAANRLGVWAVAVPVLGGLIVGLMARYGSERIRGHGIPEALEAILIGRSRMSAKIAVLKPLSSAIAIGTGGPFGAEGPIIMTGGAFGSLFAQVFHLSPAERKTLLVAGAAGGMAAVFGTPVAATLLAVELLLFEWKPRSFIPVACAAAVAAALRVPLLGAGPLFPVTAHAALSWPELVTALGLGVAAGFASGGLTWLVYACEDLFRKLPIHWMWWPLLGGAVVGLGGLLYPRALGVGYDTIHDLLTGRLVGLVLLGLVVTKAVIWAVALGSGTSGGVLAPLLIMGGSLGALEAHWIPSGDPGLWAAISMGAMMGGTMRSPFTAVAFVLELTHDINVLPGLFIACIAAHAVTVLLMKRSILTEKVARRGYHLTREYTVNPLQLLRVRDVMEPPLLVRGDGAPTVVYPDELLESAMRKLLEHEVDMLPVANPDDPSQVVGYVERSAILAAWVQVTRDEHTKEQGWLGRLRNAPR
jgi:H+/Cl- antiporter ClcA